MLQLQKKFKCAHFNTSAYPRMFRVHSILSFRLISGMPMSNFLKAEQQGCTHQDERNNLSVGLCMIHVQILLFIFMYLYVYMSAFS